MSFFFFLTQGCKCVSVSCASTPVPCLLSRNRIIFKTAEGRWSVCSQQPKTEAHVNSPQFRDDRIYTPTATELGLPWCITSEGLRKNKGGKISSSKLLGNTHQKAYPSASLCHKFLLNHRFRGIPAKYIFWVPDLQRGHGFQTEHEVRETKQCLR